MEENYKEGKVYHTGWYVLKMKKKMRSLETYLTSRLNRNETVKEGIKKRVENQQDAFTIHREKKLSSYFARNIYNTIILSSMTYGMKSTASRQKRLGNH